MPVKMEMAPMKAYESIVDLLDPEDDIDTVFSDTAAVEPAPFAVIYPDTKDLTALRNVTSDTWRIPICLGGGAAFADLDSTWKVSSLSYNADWITTLTGEMTKIIAGVAHDPVETEIRFIDMPHLKFCALWILRGEEDKFVVFYHFSDEQLVHMDHDAFVSWVKDKDEANSKSWAAARAAAIASGRDPDALGG